MKETVRTKAGTVVEFALPFDPVKVADPEPLRLVGAVTVPMGKPTGWSVLMLTDVIATLELMLHVKETSFLVLLLPRVPLSDTLATIGTGGLAGMLLQFWRDDGVVVHGGPSRRRHVRD